jgi:tyrosyl-tRNA synthetase
MNKSIKEESIEALYNFLQNHSSEIIEKDSFLKKLNSGKKLVIKCGADPSKPDLHLGHSIVLGVLRKMQDAGHTVVFVIGDYTAMIGDPSGKSKTRPQLSLVEAQKNAKTYFEQAGKILDTKKAEIRYNSEWFKKMTFEEILKITSHFTVARILERDDFEKRYKGGMDIGLHELLYPVMQAYDSVVLEADVEIGGTDQKFNMLAGRELQKKMGQTPQDVITMKILVGLDGKEKMSKSLDNYIALTDEANTMYAKVMSIKDEMMDDYYALLTDIEGQGRDIADPMQRKKRLAETITALYWGDKKAKEAALEFEKIFSKKELPKNIKEHILNATTVRLPDFLVDMGMAPSKTQAQRLIEQGAVDVGGRTVTDWKNEIHIDDGMVVKCGKRQFVRIRVKK